jgi:hypothetical protein
MLVGNRAIRGAVMAGIAAHREKRITYATIMWLASRQTSPRLKSVDHVARHGKTTLVRLAAEFSPPLYFTSGDKADRLIEQGRKAIKERLSELEVEFRKVMDRDSAQVE